MHFRQQLQGNVLTNTMKEKRETFYNFCTSPFLLLGDTVLINVNVSISLYRFVLFHMVPVGKLSRWILRNMEHALMRWPLKWWHPEDGPVPTERLGGTSCTPVLFFHPQMCAGLLSQPLSRSAGKNPCIKTTAKKKILWSVCLLGSDLDLTKGQDVQRRFLSSMETWIVAVCQRHGWELTGSKSFCLFSLCVSLPC